MKQVKAFSFTTFLSLLSFEAHAYIGPGMGLGMAVTVLGLFIAFVLLLIGLIWLPIRRFLREQKQSREADVQTQKSSLSKD